MVSLKDITLRYLLSNPGYLSLVEGLVHLDVPETITINKKEYPVPETMEQFSENICYGQKLFLCENETDYIGSMIRFVAGYYFPIVTGEVWDREKALNFFDVIIDCQAIELFPVANRNMKLIVDLATRERRLLRHSPKKEEIIAGIDKLAKFAELSAVKHLQDAMKISREQVFLLPYNDCLVEFYMAKEQAEFNERLIDAINNKKS